MMPERLCLHCGGPVRDRHRIYCCDDCKRRGGRYFRGEECPPRFCVVCGEVIPKGDLAPHAYLLRKTCSEECNRQIRAANARAAAEGRARQKQLPRELVRRVREFVLLW